MKIEIWSDVVCPWCYLGKRRFEAALTRFAHRDEVDVRWRSFELDPHAPRDHPDTLDALLARKKGMTLTRAAEMNARMTELAAAEGLEYHLDRARSGNTLDAHRLLHLAADRGLQDALKECLLRAYFTDGLPIGDVATLVGLASEVGMDADEARAVLASDSYADAVRADERRAAMLGITGVPFVVIDDRYGISGAQSPEVFLDALEQAWAASRPLAVVGGTGSACAGDACAVAPSETM